jgi:hypothetical protein
MTQYYALVNDEYLVTAVEVVSAEYIEENPNIFSGNWIETFIDIPGKTYAGIGYTYDPLTQDFIAPIYNPILPES